MAIIYRVESASNGYGPYRYTEDGVYDDLVQRYGHNNPITHPSSGNDGLWGPASTFGEYRHGFDSFERLIAWFGDAAATLELTGYTIRRYDVAEGRYAVGNSGLQVIFDPSYATPR